MRTFRYWTAGSAARSVTCEYVEFEPGHVVFYNRPSPHVPRFIVRAVYNQSCHDLEEVVPSENTEERSQ